MKNILSKSQFRQLQVIELLYSNQATSIIKLSKKINTSEKTLRQDIQELNILLAPSRIDISSISGLSLQLDTKMSIESIYSLFLFKSTEFLIIEHVFFHNYQCLDSLAEELFISTSTLRRMIATINQNLETINCQIDSQVLDLVGNENQICNFMIHYFEEKYRNSSAIFPKIQLKTLNKIFLTVFNSLEVTPNYPDLEKLRLWSMVILTRIKTGHRFTFTKEQHDRLPKEVLNNSLLKQLFRATFSIQLTPDVFFQVFYFFFNNKYCQTLEQLDALAKKDRSIAELIESLYQFLESISNKLEIELENKDELVLDLYNMDALYYGNSYILYNRYQAYIESITHDYSNFYHFIKKEVNQNPFIKKKKWSQDAINNFFYMLITHWPDLAHGIEKSIPVFSGALFFDTDTEHVKMLQDRLSYFFQDRLNFTILESLTLSELKKSATQYDMLLTNLFDIELKKTRVVVLPLALQTSDLKKIDEVYLDLLQESDTF